MGVVIKNMDLPDSCVYCPLAIPAPDNERTCFITGRNVDLDYYSERDAHCPMRESED